MSQRQALPMLVASAVLRSKELKNRILFLLGALVVYRIGTHVPLPGVDAFALSAYQDVLNGGLFGLFDTFSGGAFSRMSMFVLSVFPYISASIIMMIARFAVPYFAELSKDGSKGRAQIEQYTKYLAVIIALVQGFGLAKGIQTQEVEHNGEMLRLVADQSIMFPIHTAITIAASTMLLTWLGERMTTKGLHQGLSVLIFAGIVVEMPSVIGQLAGMNQVGTLSGFGIIGLIIFIISILAFCCFVENSVRKLALKNPRALSQAKQGNIDFTNESYLPYKVNSPGVMPVIFGSVVMSGLVSGLALFPESELAVTISSYVSRGSVLYGMFYALVIVGFSFIMAAAMYDTKTQSDNLRKNGDFLPGLRPGKPTQVYLDYVLTRLTAIGALYLAIVCVLPEFIGLPDSVVMQFSGTSILIMVSVVIGMYEDVKRYIKEQVQSELMSRHSLRKGPRRKVQR